MLQTSEVTREPTKQKFVSQAPTLRGYTHPETAMRTRELANLRLVTHIPQTLHDAIGRVAAGEYAERYAIRQLALSDDVAIDTAGLQFAQLPQRGLTGSQRRQINPILDPRCRIDTATELTYYQNDGILHYVIRNML